MAEQAKGPINSGYCGAASEFSLDFKRDVGKLVLVLFRPGFQLFNQLFRSRCHATSLITMIP
jgi:hypothetical protein